jgi:hypothetical protein
MKEYFEGLKHEALNIEKRNKGGYGKDGEQREKKVWLKSNPYVNAFSKMEKIMRLNMLGELFEYNSRKNARMSQGQINAWKKVKKGK